MKYIDADKLIAEIERLAKSYQDPTFITVRGNAANNFRDNLLSFITSLQKEQPEVLKIWLTKQFNLAQKCMKSAERDWERAYENGQMEAYGNVLSFIDGSTDVTSKQAQPKKVDLVAELKHHLATTPKEQLEKEWKELEHWNSVGPTVQEFLYGKQPEVDLEKETDQWRHKHFNGKRDGDYSGEYLKRESQLDLARHFYELGLNARKEE